MARTRRSAAALTLFLGVGCSAERPSAGAPSYLEDFRPQYHFTPAKNWMNDPNGLVYFDGEYHLFYQHNPEANVWGNMGWGHAVSRDLLTWQHLPLAIPTLGDENVFSGSAVVDWHNTTGFGADGAPPLVAIYTAHNWPRRNESQALAYSTDRGRSWTRYAGNPVLDAGLQDFRDPKVFWYEPGRRWIMTVSESPARKVRIYGSPDLKSWTLLSTFGPSGAVGGVWECPDLFPLPVDGDAARTKWVLIVNLNPGGVAGGSGTQYFVGEFDGARFVADATPGDTALWLDHGRDNYAGITFADIPPQDGRRILIGWMNNWDYGDKIPTDPWRSAQTIPRELTLRSTPRGPRLAQAPVRELASLRGAAVTLAERPIAEGVTDLTAARVRGRALELTATFELLDADTVGLLVRRGGGEETRIGIAVADQRLFVDRSRSGRSDFSDKFPGVHAAPLRIADGVVTLRVLLDWSSVEVFGDDGLSSVTDQVFPSASSDGVALFAVGGTARLRGLTAWPLRSSMTATQLPRLP